MLRPLGDFLRNDSISYSAAIIYRVSIKRNIYFLYYIYYEGIYSRKKYNCVQAENIIFVSFAQNTQQLLTACANYLCEHRT